MKKILCIGSVTTDIILRTVDRLPAPGELQAVENTSVHIGGCAANAARDLRKLGCQAQLCCKVGTDMFGEYVLQKTREEGMDPAGIIFSPNTQTTVSVVTVNSDGERSFLYNPGSTAAFEAADIPTGLVDWADIVFVAGALLTPAFDGVPCARFLEKCRQAGKVTVMDTAWDYEDRWRDKIQAAWPFLDWFMPSLEEAKKLSGLEKAEEIAAYFQSAGVRNVMIKLGAKGVYVLLQNGESRMVPAFKNIAAVDTTGAGDAFCAGFLAGLSMEWTPFDSAELGNAVGGHCIMQVGASSGIPPLPEILRFINHRKGDTYGD